MSITQQIALVNKLQQMRTNLVRGHKKRKAAKKRKIKKKKITFKTKELEDIYNNMTPEMRKLIGG